MATWHIQAGDNAGPRLYVLCGDVPQSIARSVSRDGTIVVGLGTSTAGSEAFKWTSAGGKQSVGRLSGGAVFAMGSGVSDHAGTPLPPFATGGTGGVANNAIIEGDDNVFFQAHFDGCPE